MGLKLNMTKYAEFPSIAPVPEGVHRPFWSVMIPTYNCADYLAETLKSVLDQAPDPEEMQIEVVDDCSTKDDPETVVKQIGKGRVSFFRQPQNVGPQANFTTCIQRAKGQWLHILHGDDAVMLGFYSCFRAAFEKEPSIGAAFCRTIFIDEKGNRKGLSPVQRETPGILSDWLERIAIQQQIQTPTIVVKRSVYEKLGGFHQDLFHNSDWEMWKRIAVNFPFWYEPQPLACYRQHSSSHSSSLFRSGANVVDRRRAIEVSQAYLPKPIADELSAQAREFSAIRAIKSARRLFKVGDKTAAIAQIREGLKCSHSSNVIRSLADFLVWTVKRWSRRTIS